MVEGIGSTRYEQRRPDQPTESILGTFVASTGPLHYYGRLRFDRELVCPRSEDQERHDGFSIRKPGDDVSGYAVCHCRKIRVPGENAYCAHWRWRHADVGDQRNDHHFKILEAMEEREIH